MLETAKKTILFGIGALCFTKEKGERLIKELVDKGKLTQGEATILVEGIMKKGTEEKEALKDLVQEELQKFQHSIGFVTRAEGNDIGKRLQKLEENIAALIEKLDK